MPFRCVHSLVYKLEKRKPSIELRAVSGLLSLGGSGIGSGSGFGGASSTCERVVQTKTRAHNVRAQIDAGQFKSCSYASGDAVQTMHVAEQVESRWRCSQPRSNIPPPPDHSAQARKGRPACFRRLYRATEAQHGYYSKRCVHQTRDRPMAHAQ